MTRPAFDSLRRQIPLCACLAVSCLSAVAVAEPASQAPPTSQSAAPVAPPTGLEDLFLAPRTSFFSDAAPDLAKGLALNGALAFGADRALQSRSSDPTAGIAFGTSSAFTIAPILRTHYGWAAGASAYAFAVATGTYAYTRQESSHSSVLLGSALGLAVGEAVAFHSTRVAAVRDHVIVGSKRLGFKMKF